MKSQVKSLGKVCVTCNGVWDANVAYDRVCIVLDDITGRSYISTKEVPTGISLDNIEYWQPFTVHVIEGNIFVKPFTEFIPFLK